MTELHAAAARAVSRLEPADDGAALLADPRDRRRIAMALSVAVLGAVAIVLGENLPAIVDVVRSLTQTTQSDGATPRVFLRTEWSTDVAAFARSIGLALLLLGMWVCAKAPRAGSGAPLLSSPRRILRITAAALLCNQALDLFEAGHEVFSARTLSGLSDVATVSELLDSTLGLAAIPAFLSAVLFGRALARASGAARTDAWLDRSLWILPLLTFVAPATVMVLMVVTQGNWFGFRELLGVDPFAIARGAFTVGILISLRREVGRAGSTSPLPAPASLAQNLCPRCGYSIDPEARCEICPECGSNPALLRQTPPRLQTARRGVTLILIGAFSQIIVWSLVAYCDLARLRLPRPGTDRWIPFLNDLRSVLIVLVAALPLVNIIGWWCLASRATPQTLDRRERRLRDAARIALVANAMIVAAVVAGVLFDSLPIGRFEWSLGVIWLIFVAIALWWWPAVGRTVRAALEVDAPHTTKVALAAFWLLPCLAWSTGAFQSQIDGVNLWSALVEILRVAWREDISPEMIARSTAPSPLRDVFSALAATSIFACALAYFAYLSTLHRAFRRAERRAERSTPTP